MEEPGPVGEGPRASLGPRESLMAWDWNDILPRHVSQYLDITDILCLRQANRTLYCSRRFRGARLNVGSLGWLNEAYIWHNVLPLTGKVLTPGSFQHLVFDGFSNLSEHFYRALFSDLTVLPAQIIAPITREEEPKKEDSPQCKGVPSDTPPAPALSPALTPAMECTIRTLSFNFCAKISDPLLQQLLETQMPSLESLSLRCIKTPKLTGQPFCDISKNTWTARWPRFREFDGSFTHISLAAFDRVAAFCLGRSLDIEASASVDLIGSVASLTYFRMLTLSEAHDTFICTIESGCPQEVEHSIRSFEVEYAKQADMSSLKRMIINKLLKGSARELLIHAPFPIIQKQNDAKNQPRPQVALPTSDSLDTESSDVDLGKEGRDGNLDSGDGTVPQHPAKYSYPLYAAIRRGCKEIVDLLINDNKYRLDIGDFDGAIPVYVATNQACFAEKCFKESKGTDAEIQAKAVAERRCNVLKALLRAGARSDPPDVNSKRWPVNAAAKSDCTQVLSILMSYGAKVNMPGRRYGNFAGGAGPRPPLTIACEAEPLARRAIHLLTKCGADVIGMAKAGQTTISQSPLLICYRRVPDLLPTFIDAIPEEELLGCNMDDESVSRSPVYQVLAELLSQAITKQDTATIGNLAGAIPKLIEVRHAIWGTPIIQACKILHDEESVASIVNAYEKFKITGDFARKDTYGRTPLLVAIQECNQAVVKALVAVDCDINTADNEGITGFHWACRNNMGDFAILLAKEYKADPSAINDLGFTPLISAILERHSALALRLLLELGPKRLRVDAADSLRRTALIHSIQMGLFDVGHQLIELGCNVTWRDSEGLNAAEWLKRCIEGNTQSLRIRVTSKLSRMRHGPSSNASVRSKASAHSRASSINSLRRGSSLRLASNSDAGANVADSVESSANITEFQVTETDLSTKLEIQEQKRKAAKELLKVVEEVTKNRRPKA